MKADLLQLQVLFQLLGGLCCKTLLQWETQLSNGR